MRPTGVVLIAVYHFLTAIFLLYPAVMVGAFGTVLGSLIVNNTHDSQLGGIGVAVGAFFAIFVLFCAAVAAVSGYGVWVMREWGRILSIVVEAISLVFALPGILLGQHVRIFFVFGTFGLIRIVIAGAIIWYLVQPQIAALFRRTAPVAPSA